MCVRRGAAAKMWQPSSICAGGDCRGDNIATNEYVHRKGRAAAKIRQPSSMCAAVGPGGGGDDTGNQKRGRVGGGVRCSGAAAGDLNKLIRGGCSGAAVRKPSKVLIGGGSGGAAARDPNKVLRGGQCGSVAVWKPNKVLSRRAGVAGALQHGNQTRFSGVVSVMAQQSRELCGGVGRGVGCAEVRAKGMGVGCAG